MALAELKQCQDIYATECADTGVFSETIFQ